MLQSSRCNKKKLPLRSRTVKQSRPPTPCRTSRWTQKPRSPPPPARETPSRLQPSQKATLILKAKRQMMHKVMKLKL